VSEERRPDDPTRRMLRVFGVTVSNYEERTARLREGPLDGIPADELRRLAAEAIAQTAELNAQLRLMTDHVLETQNAVLAQVKAALDRAG
jgi:hypothetical protein